MVVLAGKVKVALLGEGGQEIILAMLGPGSFFGEMAILRGLNTSDETDDLHDAHAVLDNDIRTTHILGRQYDRILFSEALKQDDPNRKDLVFNRAVVRRDLVVQGEIDENHSLDIRKCCKKSF